MSETDLGRKVRRLREILASLGEVVIAFSGGVDSSYLLAEAAAVLGPSRVAAVTIDSPLLPRTELEMARCVAAQLGVEHRIVHLDELGQEPIASNPPDRCYYCKRFRFESVQVRAAEAFPGRVLLHGENGDDHLDYRPGSRAAAELGVRAPLAEAGLTKEEIRQLSKLRGLPTWDLPAEACLATRFPAGVALSAEGLARVERAEVALRGLLGRGGLRVRDHFPLARLELPVDLIPVVAQTPLRERVVQVIHECGYRYVTIDLDGYRMGSMNEQPRTS
ncbi:MAG: ATP-dependent sacrificial sulfur transferase LarE [Anaerolineae bacterium]|nr:ATP-dependent sacrificial sulfur transferase LarE [Chloroflexota bacterium]